MIHEREDDNLIRQLDVTVTGHIREELIRDVKMAEQIKELSDKVDALTTNVELLLSMWQQAKGVVSFIKWMSVIAGGFVTFILYMKDHWKW